MYTSRNIHVYSNLKLVLVNSAFSLRFLVGWSCVQIMSQLEKQDKQVHLVFIVGGRAWKTPSDQLARALQSNIEYWHYVQGWPYHGLLGAKYWFIFWSQPSNKGWSYRNLQGARKRQRLTKKRRWWSHQNIHQNPSTGHWPTELRGSATHWSNTWDYVLIWTKTIVHQTDSFPFMSLKTVGKISQKNTFKKAK